MNHLVQRDRNLQTFVRALERTFSCAALAGPDYAVFTHKLFAALEVQGSAGRTSAAELPVCKHLDSALQFAALSGPETAELGSTIGTFAPHLTWKMRSSGGPHASENWQSGHANAVVIGAGGLEERDDIAIGLSLLAPRVRYPDHTHPPEELYMIVTQGRFQHGDEAWSELGPGDTFHNAPGIKHAMAAGQLPLLAVWTMLVK